MGGNKSPNGKSDVRSYIMLLGAEHNVQIESGNLDNLKDIESAILVLCLDVSAPITREDTGRGLWHGVRASIYKTVPR